MKITAIKRQKGRRSRVNVYVGETRISMSAEVATAAGLRVGDELSENAIEELQAKESAWRCKEMALNLLSFRPRSRRELRDRLLRRDVPPVVVEGCLSDLERAGLIDDDAFGTALALDRLRSRPAGRSRLVAELRSKGLSAEVAEGAVRRALEEAGIPEVELARRAARKFRRRPAEDVRRASRRLYAFLARRGFGGETATTVIEEMIAKD